MAVIAIDLGGTKLAGALFNEDGRILQKSRVPLAGRQGGAAGELVCREVKRLLAHAQARRVPVSAIGVCVPGISYAETGKVWAPNIPGWKDYPLRREIEAAVLEEGASGSSGASEKPLKRLSEPQRSGDTRLKQGVNERVRQESQGPSGNELRVVIDSDRACYILGETWRGAAKGCRNAIFLAVGTGIGAGILIDGQVLRGAQDIAGAIGWLALERPFRPEYVSCGCFEYHASGAGLAKVAQELLARQPGKPSSRRFNALSARDVFAAYERGDAVAKEVVTQAVEFWGMAVANLVSLFNPEKIVFGGGVFGPATQFLDDIYAEAKKWAQPISIKQVRLQASKLGGDAGLYGAACLGLKSREEKA